MSEWWTYRLSSFLLFSPRTYYRLFELYNRAICPAQALALGLGLWILFSLVARLRGRGGASVPAILAACWLCVAVAFLALRYATINFAAVYFAWAFGLEAALLVGLGVVRRGLAFERPTGAIGRAGWRSSLSRSLVEPLAGPLLGRGWRQVEIFGVAPDPTAVATLGTPARRPRAGPGRADDHPRALVPDDGRVSRGDGRAGRVGGAGGRRAGRGPRGAAGMGAAADVEFGRGPIPMPEGNTIHRLARIAHARLRRPPHRGELAAGAVREGGAAPGRAAVPAGRRVRQAPVPSLERRPRRARAPGHGRVVLPSSRSDPDAAADRADAPRDAGARAGSHRPADVRGDSRVRAAGSARAAGHGSAARGLRSRARVGRAARAAAPHDRRRAARPARARGRRQHLPQRGAVPRRHSSAAAVRQPDGGGVGAPVADDAPAHAAGRDAVGDAHGRSRPSRRTRSPGGDADDDFYVYQQEACRRCASPIDEFPLSARRMFACPRCQPRRQ